MTPLLSILTPSFNQGRFIRETLASVRSQNDANVEHLVMDGGSTDETLEILEQAARGDARIEWWSEPDRGQSHALNKLLDRAGGELIGWLNSDDCYLPGAFAAVRNAFAGHPEALVVYGDYEETDAASRIVRPRRAFEDGVESFILFWEGRANIGQPAVFWRRGLIERIGRLDESLHYCMDWDFWVRARRVTEFEHVAQPLATCRLHADGKTARIDMARETVRHAAKYVDWLPAERRAAAREKLSARQAWHDVQERASAVVFGHLVDEVARRAGGVRTIVVYGCGLNARRLSERLVPWAAEQDIALRWADDDATNPYLYWVPRVEAIEDAGGDEPDTLVLITPWSDEVMVERARFLATPRALLRWRELFARSEPAVDVATMMEAANA
jgi:glycosyltransferase involved in cell wall biosynthesis